MKPLFTITHSDDRATVVWEARTYQPPTEGHETELSELIGRYDLVIFDFSTTSAISTRWLRLIQRLSIRAEQMAKLLAIVGLSTPLLEKADLVAIKNDLHIYESLDQVPEP